MSRKRWILCIAGVSLAAALACSVGLFLDRGRERVFVNEYRGARPLVPQLHPEFPSKTWNAVLPLPNGVTVSLTAKEGYDTMELRYSDDTQDRQVFDREDYVGVRDIRTSDDGGVLFVYTSGLAGGLCEESYIDKYDLCERRLVHRVQTNNSPSMEPASIYVPIGCGIVAVLIAGAASLMFQQRHAWKILVCGVVCTMGFVLFSDYITYLGSLVLEMMALCAAAGVAGLLFRLVRRLAHR